MAGRTVVLAVIAGAVVVVGCSPLRDEGLTTFQSTRDGNFEIYLMNADGSRQVRLTHSPSNDISPSLSPDGSRIVFASDRDGNWEIYSIHTDGSELTRLTSGEGSNTSPSWSPGGSKILFISTRDTVHGEVYAMNADGSSVRRLTRHPSVKDTPVISPDMKRIFVTLNDRGHRSIGVFATTGAALGILTPRSCNSLNPRLSRDGTTIMFVSDRAGNFDIYTMPAKGGTCWQRTFTPDDETSGAWTSDPSLVLIARNIGIYQHSLDSRLETPLSMRGDSAPHSTIH